MTEHRPTATPASGPAGGGAGPTSSVPPRLDPASPLRFVVNAGAGAVDVDAKRSVIEAALAEHGRRGELRVCGAADLPRVAREAASAAAADGSAVVAVGGDGSLNTVAQACHAAGCPMGVMPYGTFNYFARTHGLPTEPAAAARLLMRAGPRPVQVAAINQRLFLVNASLGLYPQLLQDREAYKAQFGRSRLVALGSAFVTLLREHRQLKLRIDHAGGTRVLRTPTLFVGNNPLQLQQIGLPEATQIEHGQLAAVLLKPVSTLAMLGLLARGALGQLGEADDVLSFAFDQITVAPAMPYGKRRIKVATDGEIGWAKAPLQFRVSPQPLYLLKPAPAEA